MQFWKTACHTERGLANMTKNQEINKIAAELLNLHTLETQHSDSKDIHELAIWSIERALDAAYEAGRRENTKN